MTDGTATTKGSILRSLLTFLERELTADQWKRVLDDLDPDEYSLATKPTLPSAHIPESLLNHLTAAAAREKGEDLTPFGIRAGKAELLDAVRLYRFLFLVLTPNALLAKASSSWSSVHNTGVMSVDDKTSESARVTLRFFASEPAHCARLTGWFVGLAEMTGAKAVAIDHTRCLTRGDADCSWQLRWS